MNIKLIRKFEKRLQDLENKAKIIKAQIIDQASYKEAKISINNQSLESELQDTLLRIKNINAANKRF